MYTCISWKWAEAVCPAVTTDDPIKAVIRVNHPGAEKTINVNKAGTGLHLGSTSDGAESILFLAACNRSSPACFLLQAAAPLVTVFKSAFKSTESRCFQPFTSKLYYQQ